MKPKSLISMNKRVDKLTISGMKKVVCTDTKKIITEYYEPLYTN